MSASRPSSTSSRRRGAMCTPSPAIRRKQASTASTASAGESSSRTSLSERNRARRLILLDEADRPVRLDDGPRDVVQRADLLLARLLRYLFLRHALASQIPLHDLAVIDQHQRLALEHLACAPRAERQVRREHLEGCDGRDREHGAGDGVVVLRQALLDRVTED